MVAFGEALCVCLGMGCGDTLQVDSIHSKVCFCESEYAAVLVTKTGHVEMGDNSVNKHFPNLFPQTKQNKKLVHLTQ